MPSGIKTRTSGIMVNVNVTPSQTSTIVFGPVNTLGGNDDFANQTLVQPIGPSFLTAATGTQARFTVQMGVTFANLTTITSYFGQKGVGLQDFTGNQVQILFGGINLIGDGGADRTFVSDWITLGEAWDATQAYILAAQITVASGGFAFDDTIPGGPTSYFKAGADAATTTKSGYGGNRTTVFEFIKQIEVR